MTLVATMLNPRIPFQFPTMNKASKPIIFFPILISYLIFLPHGSITAAETTNIGVIIDANSRIGKEQKVAIEIAVEEFNNHTSTKHKLSLHFGNSGTVPLQAAYAVFKSLYEIWHPQDNNPRSAPGLGGGVQIISHILNPSLLVAEELILEKQVQVIVGMETWHQSALVADIGNRSHVPVLSLAATATSPPQAALRWPFLVRFATKASEQVSCIASILRSFKWKRVIAIYEDDFYGADSGILSMLSEALQDSGSVIEGSLVFPPLSSLPNPQDFIRKEVTKLLHKKSRVFVVLQSSLSLATHLFREANELGLIGRDSVWIVTETVSSLLDSVNNSVISSMQGALGIDQAYFPEKSISLDNFRAKFKKILEVEYSDEHNYEPGIHAFRAYDSINTTARALEKLGTTNRTQKLLLEGILSSNFAGLSGEIRFNGAELSQEVPVFRIINVIEKEYKEIGLWSPKFGFREGNGGSYSNKSIEMWVDSINWPGKLRRVPKGWAMPSLVTPMRIVVPGNSSFGKCVNVKYGSDRYISEEKKYTGFCIDVFRAVVGVVEQSYLFPYDFYPVNDTYDALVESIANKTYDALVGDVTILENRSQHVEFTQPFVESGLSLVVPLTSEPKAWMFMKPFTMKMWTVTGVVMVYTMAIVWFLEHPSNPEFRGPWKDQLSAAQWFTFSSLFFAHREKIQSNYTKVVVVLWFLVVFVVTASYTANLTSMLTVMRADVKGLEQSKAVVGYDGDLFVKDYLQNVINFTGRMKTIEDQAKYYEQFKSGAISALFLELLYAKVFVKDHCDEYTTTGPVYRLGGFGFVFQKGSPIASDFSEAILAILENGELKRLEEKWINQFTSCSNYNATATQKVDSLHLLSFWGLYLISAATSTLCSLFFLVQSLKKYLDSSRENQGTSTLSRNSIWPRMVSFARYFHNGGIRVRPSEILDHHLEGPRPLEIEIPTRTG